MAFTFLACNPNKYAKHQVAFEQYWSQFSDIKPKEESFIILPKMGCKSSITEFKSALKGISKSKNIKVITNDNQIPEDFKNLQVFLQ
jgi:hypothetical protein